MEASALTRTSQVRSARVEIQGREFSGACATSAVPTSQAHRRLDSTICPVSFPEAGSLDGDHFRERTGRTGVSQIQGVRSGDVNEVLVVDRIGFTRGPDLRSHGTARPLVERASPRMRGPGALAAALVVPARSMYFRGLLALAGLGGVALSQDQVEVSGVIRKPCGKHAGEGCEVTVEAGDATLDDPRARTAFGTRPKLWRMTFFEREVMLRQHGGSSSPVRTTTDSEGRFKIMIPSTLPSFRLRVRGQSLAYLSPSRICSSEDSDFTGLEITTEQTGSVKGILHEPSGTGEGGLVVLLRLGDKGGLVHGYTDSAGAFGLDHLLPGKYRVFLARTDKHGPIAGGEVVVRAGETVNVEMELRTGARIRGRVMTEGRVPVSSALVRVRPIEGWLASPLGTMFCPFGTSDQKGYFEIGPVGEDAFRLWVTADGFRLYHSEDLRVVGAHSPPEVEVNLVRGGSIIAKVVDDRGVPVRNAILVATEIPGPQELVRLARREETMSTDARWAETDQEGRAVFDGVSDAPYRVSLAGGREYAQGAGSILRVGVQGGVSFPRTGGLSGKVVDVATGVPVREYEVRYRLVSSESSGLMAAGETLAVRTRTGGFEIRNIAPGSYALDVIIGGVMAGGVDVEVIPGRMSPPVAIRVARS